MYNRELETNAAAMAQHNASMKAAAEKRRDDHRAWNKLHGKGLKKVSPPEVALP